MTTLKSRNHPNGTLLQVLGEKEGPENRVSWYLRAPPPPARAETWASSWPEDSDDGGTPSGTGASGTLVDEDAGGVNGRFEACSAVRACLTALTTDARKVGEG